MARFCSKCGSPLREKDNFCRKCGARVKAETPKPQEHSVKKTVICLSAEEMRLGCTKVVDFGTGKKYGLDIPAGLSTGDIITAEPLGLTDPKTGMPCRIEMAVTAE